MDEKIVLRIATKYGEYYDITESGNIIRLDQPGFKPSGQWKLRGIVMASGFRLLIEQGEPLPSYRIMPYAKR